MGCFTDTLQVTVKGNYQVQFVQRLANLIGSNKELMVHCFDSSGNSYVALTYVDNLVHPSPDAQTFVIVKTTPEGYILWTRYIAEPIIFPRNQMLFSVPGGVMFMLSSGAGDALSAAIKLDFDGNVIFSRAWEGQRWEHGSYNPESGLIHTGFFGRLVSMDASNGNIAGNVDVKANGDPSCEYIAVSLPGQVKCFRRYSSGADLKVVTMASDGLTPLSAAIVDTADQYNRVAPVQSGDYGISESLYAFIEGDNRLHFIDDGDNVVASFTIPQIAFQQSVNSFYRLPDSNILMLSAGSGQYLPMRATILNGDLSGEVIATLKHSRTGANAAWNAQTCYHAPTDRLVTPSWNTFSSSTLYFMGTRLNMPTQLRETPQVLALDGTRTSTILRQDTVAPLATRTLLTSTPATPTATALTPLV